MTAASNGTAAAACLEAALAYAWRGWAVFPLWWTDGVRCACAKGAKCPDQAKHPIGSLVPHGVKDASRDETTIRAWWARNPRANVAIATGEVSGVDVIDLDVHGESNGRETFAALVAQHGELLAPFAETGGGGLHYFLRHHDGVGNSSGRLPGVDVRGDKGYVVAAPSVHRSGKAYGWGRAASPEDLDAPPWPEWLIEKLRKPAQAVVAAATAPSNGAASLGGKKLLQLLHDDVATAGKGRRDDTRNAVAFRAGRFVAAGKFTRDEVVEAIVAACVKNKLAEEEGEGRLRIRTEHGVDDGIAEGPTAGMVRRANSSRTSPGQPPPSRVVVDARGVAEHEDSRERVLVPGNHRTETGRVEQTTDTFTNAVLDALPAGALYRMGTGPGTVVGSVVGPTGGRSFEALDANAARILIDTLVDLRRAGYRKEAEGKLVPFDDAVPCSRDYAQLVLAKAKTDARVPELRVLVRYPVYLPGFVRAAPGFNPSGGVFYDEPEELRDLAPRAQDALQVLDDLTVDFPFKRDEERGTDDASRVNAYAYALTFVLRPAIEGPTPFFFVMAQQERTGKGKLIDTLATAVTGDTVPPVQLRDDEAEREKRVTSLIVAAAAAVHFDNVPVGRDLDSETLASLATAWPRWSGRRLGKSEMVDLPNSLVVALSGNNPKATGEIAKRSIPVVLEARNGSPELRDDFQHPDALAYAHERRRVVLEALLGMVEAWRAARRPPAKDLRLGGFERWVAAVGGVLQTAGAKDLLGNYSAWVRLADDFGADAATFVAEWCRRKFPPAGENEPQSSKQLLDIANDASLFGEVLNSPTDRGRQTQFSMRVLRQLSNRTFVVAQGAAFTIKRIGTGGSSRYQLSEAELP